MTTASTVPGASPAGRLRRWLAGRTLRGRLIAGLLALLFVACATVGVVTYLALRGFLLGQLDDQLTAASVRYAECVNGPRRGPPPHDPQSPRPQGTYPAPDPAGRPPHPAHAPATLP